ncbi:hypothetical protein [Streptomyces sp. WMMB303]|nr:hypothetical protein [Streptomyces sp. WMMB303]MDF4252858.1 hypothetical protein [Streptomyces sp. WMMB303]
MSGTARGRRLGRRTIRKIRTTQLQLTRGVGPFAGNELTGDRYTA